MKASNYAQYTSTQLTWRRIVSVINDKHAVAVEAVAVLADIPITIGARNIAKTPAVTGATMRNPLVKGADPDPHRGHAEGHDLVPGRGITDAAAVVPHNTL